jgi:hypothetical protein
MEPLLGIPPLYLIIITALVLALGAVAFITTRSRQSGHAPGTEDDLDVLEMGPVREEEVCADVPPGEPVPYEATTWLPRSTEDGSIEPLWGNGKVDWSSLPPDPRIVALQAEEASEPPKPLPPPVPMLASPGSPRKRVGTEARVPKEAAPYATYPRDRPAEPRRPTPPPKRTTVPQTASTGTMKVRCPKCGMSVRVRKQFPIKVTCPSCGSVGVLR